MPAYLGQPPYRGYTATALPREFTLPDRATARIHIAPPRYRTNHYLVTALPRVLLDYRGTLEGRRWAGREARREGGRAGEGGAGERGAGEGGRRWRRGMEEGLGREGGGREEREGGGRQEGHMPHHPSSLRGCSGNESMNLLIQRCRFRHWQAPGRTT